MFFFSIDKISYNHIHFVLLAPLSKNAVISQTNYTNLETLMFFCFFLQFSLVEKNMCKNTINMAPPPLKSKTIEEIQYNLQSLECKYYKYPFLVICN